MVKTCSKCGEEKSLEEFGVWSRSPDGRTSMCRPCKRSYDNDYYRANQDTEKPKRTARSLASRKRNIEYLRAHLTLNPCVDCGETDWMVLDFDHVSGVKRKGVTELAWQGASLVTLQAEMDKCEIRCANDHRRITWRRRLDAVHV